MESVLVRDVEKKIANPSQDLVELLAGKEVLSLLDDKAFLAAWDKLYEACPWATAFQSRAYVLSWYKIYNRYYEPIIVKCGPKEGTLTGLITLALDKSGLITGAGASQAEYQVWLTGDTEGSDFIKKAFTEIQKHYPLHTIQLKYIPHKADLGWIEKDSTWKKRCYIQAVKQPLMAIHEQALASELKKKNRKEKINRLKRLGDLKFEHITDTREFVAVLNELATQYDFRKGAMHNRVFFKEEPHRKDFLIQLFRQGLLHVTVLKVGNTIIASNVGVAARNWVHLQGLNTHAPAYARHSPGILHFLMLGRHLAEEGIDVFDLTPGADAYKDTLATEYVTAYQLSIDSTYNRFKKHLKGKAIGFIKNSLYKTGIAEGKLKSLKVSLAKLADKGKLIKNQGLFQFFAGSAINARFRRKRKLYMVLPEVSLHMFSVAPEKDSMKDLLCFNAAGTLTTRWEFLEDAMRRFEMGEHSYTWVEKGCLLGCIWLSEPRSIPAGKQSAVALPDGVALLQNLYIHPAGRGRLNYFLSAVAAQITKGNGQVYFSTGTLSAKHLQHFTSADFNKVHIR
jgi:CelD/BcsL family acetyltransferase involved in cellulose biosynthesis